jgi:glycosyltransferase involved in cell wall biosynthesis
MTQFAKNEWRVIYCNITQSNKPIEEVLPNLFVCHNFQSIINKIKNKQIEIDVKLATWARSVDYFDYIPSKVTIYYSCDSFDEWKPYEQKIIDKSDIVLCTSRFIYDLRKNQHKNVHLVRNAATSNFITNNEYTIPSDMVRLKQNNNKVIGFIGAVGTWVSTYLLKKVAEKYTTVLVGKEFGKPCPSNVINLGLKKHEDLLNYYNAIDVFLLPFNTKSEITLAACPIKLYEYLSVGKPIVSTGWEETELFNYVGNNGKVVLTSKSDDKFIENVDKALNMNENELTKLKNKSKIIASENTWEVRYKQIENIINKYCEEKGIRI